MVTIIRLLSFVFIDFILISLFIPLLPVNYILSVPKDTNKLVVLIHGSGVGSWQWYISTIYLKYYNINYKCIDYNYKKSLHESKLDVLKQIPNKNITLIGHSLGGLMVRLIANDVKAEKIFLLNTPQTGSPLIDWLFPIEENKNYGASFNEMRYQSTFIKNLPSFHKDVYEIVGINDYVRSAQSIHFSKNIYYSWFGHYFSAVNPYLWLTYIIPNL
jgi:pimeloyl-ACP methyl ester carboxylesterase